MKESSHSGATSYTLLLILLVYLALASLFALKTPPWQNPDEPAHYNYVAYVATEWQLPVLQMGDYDEAYLQKLKAEKFPPELSIEPVRYEFHQPPLYYLLATPFYWLSGDLLALRLFSVALGAGVVFLVFLCARTVLPNAPYIALGAAAFAAFLPMHIAVMASVNNDALAELVIAAAVLALLSWQRAVAGEDAGNGAPVSGHRHLLFVGVLIGVGFLTKATAYILLPIALIVVIVGSVQAFPGRQTNWKVAGHILTTRTQFLRYALLIAPALLLACLAGSATASYTGIWTFSAWHGTTKSSPGSRQQPLGSPRTAGAPTGSGPSRSRARAFGVYSAGWGSLWMPASTRRSSSCQWWRRWASCSGVG